MKKYIFAIGSILTLLNGATPPPSIIEHQMPRVMSSFDDCDACIEKGQQLAKEETIMHFGSLGAAIELSNNQTVCSFPTSEETQDNSHPPPLIEQAHPTTDDFQQKLKKMEGRITLLTKKFEENSKKPLLKAPSVPSPSLMPKRDDFPMPRIPHHLFDERPLIPLRSTAGNPEENEADEDGLLTTFFKILTGDPYL
ncbi:MAG: hypothetical protein KBD31_02540 [Proteobacteria bacterium]|nr:hypothetical protein [Pseudomonadota bacterium]